MKDFVQQRLLPDIEERRHAVQKIEEELRDISDFERWLEQIKETTNCISNELLVDIGMKFYVSASPENTERINVKVGMGFYLEMTLTEASEFIPQRRKVLESKRSYSIEQLAEATSTLAAVSTGIAQLQNY